jgi:hypothetical protein
VLDGVAEDDATDAAEAVDADLDSHVWCCLRLGGE